MKTPTLSPESEREFDEMYLEITKSNEKPEWNGYKYVTVHACIKQFIAKVEQRAFQKGLDHAKNN